MGVITNNRVSHATPAAFTSHARVREFEDLIAEQEGTRILFNGVDILFGGGLDRFGLYAFIFISYLFTLHNLFIFRWKKKIRFGHG